MLLETDDNQLGGWEDPRYYDATLGRRGRRNGLVRDGPEGLEGIVVGLVFRGPGEWYGVSTYRSYSV